MSSQMKAEISAANGACHDVARRRTPSAPRKVGHVPPTIAHVAFDGRGSPYPPPNANGPRVGARGTRGGATGSGAGVAGELAAVGFGEACGAALGRQLAQYCGVHGGDNVAELGPLGGHQQKGVVTLCR